MAPSHPHLSQANASYSHSLRLTFAYADREVSLVKTVRVAMLAPAGLAPVAHNERTGYWIEVRDRDGNMLYHRPLHDPLRTDVEVFDDGPGESMHRVPNKVREGEFEVIVPDLPNASDLLLFGTSAKTKKAQAPSKELLRHEFAELRRLDVNALPEGDPS